MSKQASPTTQGQQATLLNIQELNLNREPLPRFSLFEFAFRPFFLFATLFSIAHLLLWVMVWLGKITITMPPLSNALSPLLWHGHEMVFGYGYGVVVGFLLTAVTNWTKEKTPVRLPLSLLFLLWLSARIGFVLGGLGFVLAAVSDVLFSLWVLYAFTRPVVISHNQRQWGFVAKLLLLFVANLLFYFGLFGFLADGMRYGVYLGLYLLLAVVLVMGRRVIPFFTQRALGLSDALSNPRWLDISSIVLFTVFCVWDVFFSANSALAVLSVVLFALYALRLFNWYAPGLFRHSLIWSLWLANVIFISGFALKALAIWGMVSPLLAVHAFALGGVGLMTLAMMSRVSLGHTGRNVFAPSKWLIPLFLTVVAATIVRVLLPIAFVSNYRLWIMLSATLWVVAFVGFLVLYAHILIAPRADGKRG